MLELHKNFSFSLKLEFVFSLRICCKLPETQLDCSQRPRNQIMIENANETKL